MLNILDKLQNVNSFLFKINRGVKKMLFKSKKTGFVK